VLALDERTMTTMFKAMVKGNGPEGAMKIMLDGKRKREHKQNPATHAAAKRPSLSKATRSPPSTALTHDVC
jgi:hypothetical protein